MKKLILVLAMGMISISTIMAQSPVDKIFEKYNGQEGFTNVTINQYLFEMIAKMDSTADGQDMRDLAKTIENIQILAMDTIMPGVNLYEDVMKATKKANYKELMTVKEKDNDIVFLVDDRNGKIYELLMVVGGTKQDNAIIRIKGDIDLAKMGAMARSMHIDGMENLEKLGEKQ